MISFHTTKCAKAWPRHYVTYRQEMEPPYRHCKKAHVLRFGKRGLVVVPRWDCRARDALQAGEWALQIREVPIGRDGDEAELSYQSLRHRER